MKEEDKTESSETEAPEEPAHKKIDATLKKLRREMLSDNSSPDFGKRMPDSAFRRMLFSLPLFLIFWLLFWYFYFK